MAPQHPFSGSGMHRFLRLPQIPPSQIPPHKLPVLNTPTGHPLSRTRTAGVLRPLTRPLHTSSSHPRPQLHQRQYSRQNSPPTISPPQKRTLTTTPIRSLPGGLPSQQPAQLSTEKYHTLADTYIDNLVAHLEELQEEREDVDVEYSAGVLTLKFPPKGTYVLNKQPPNRQIWLSSPVSGPKRYDYVEHGIVGGGQWTYLRDGSLLTELLEEELGVTLGEADV